MTTTKKTKKTTRKKAPTTIRAAKAACVAAFKKQPNARYGWCLHHTRLIEQITEPIRRRIAYISSDKPVDEQVSRFNNMRPVKETPAFKRIKASQTRSGLFPTHTDAMMKLYRQQVPFGTWNGYSIGYL